MSATDYRKLFSHRLDTVGNGSGETSMNVDGSTVPVTHKLAPAAGQIAMVSRIIIYVKDTGAFDVDSWGNAVSMTNGLAIKVVSGDTTDLVDPITTTGELASVCYDVTSLDFGTGDDIMVGRLTLTRFGKYLRLDGSNGDELQAIVQDDLTGLTEQYVTAQGYWERG